MDLRGLDLHLASLTQASHLVMHIQGNHNLVGTWQLRAKTRFYFNEQDLKTTVL